MLAGWTMSASSVPPFTPPSSAESQASRIKLRLYYGGRFVKVSGCGAAVLYVYACFSVWFGAPSRVCQLAVALLQAASKQAHCAGVGVEQAHTLLCSRPGPQGSHARVVYQF